MDTQINVYTKCSKNALKKLWTLQWWIVNGQIKRISFTKFWNKLILVKIIEHN